MDSSHMMVMLWWALIVILHEALVILFLFFKLLRAGKRIKLLEDVLNEG